MLTGNLGTLDVNKLFCYMADLNLRFWLANARLVKFNP
jgi:hypothetical protein